MTVTLNWGIYVCNHWWSSDLMQEKEKKTFANMFDKFAMADRKKEALEKQVLYLK